MFSTRQSFIGEVVSNKMQNTVLVLVSSPVVHPKYGKSYSTESKYSAHYVNQDDSAQVLKLGTKVRITACAPISKQKKWKVTQVF